MSLLSRVFAAKTEIVQSKQERYLAALRSGDHVQIAQAADALGLHNHDLEKDLLDLQRLQELVEQVKGLPELRFNHKEADAEVASLQEELRKFQESMNKKLAPAMERAEQLRTTLSHTETRLGHLHGSYAGLAARGLADPTDLPEFCREEIAGSATGLSGHVAMSPRGQFAQVGGPHEGAVDLSAHASQRARAGK